MIPFQQNVIIGIIKNLFMMTSQICLSQLLKPACIIVNDTLESNHHYIPNSYFESDHRVHACICSCSVKQPYRCNHCLSGRASTTTSACIYDAIATHININSTKLLLTDSHTRSHLHESFSRPVSSRLWLRSSQLWLRSSRLRSST